MRLIDPRFPCNLEQRPADVAKSIIGVRRQEN